MHFSSLEKCNLEPWKPNYSIFDANFGCDLQGSVELGRNEKNPRTTQMELTWNPLLTFLEIGTNLEYASEHDPRNQTYTRNPQRNPETRPGTRPQPLRNPPRNPGTNLTRFAQTRHNLPEACPEPGPNLPPSPSPNPPQTTYSPIQQ